MLCCLSLARERTENTNQRNEVKLSIIKKSLFLASSTHDTRDFFRAVWEKIQSTTKKNSFLMNSSFGNVRAVNFNRHLGVVRRH